MTYEIYTVYGDSAHLFIQADSSNEAVDLAAGLMSTKTGLCKGYFAAKYIARAI